MVSGYPQYGNHPEFGRHSQYGSQSESEHTSTRCVNGICQQFVRSCRNGVCHERTNSGTSGVGGNRFGMESGYPDNDDHREYGFYPRNENYLENRGNSYGSQSESEQTSTRCVNGVCQQFVRNCRNGICDEKEKSGSFGGW